MTILPKPFGVGELLKGRSSSEKRTKRKHWSLKLREYKYWFYPPIKYFVKEEEIHLTKSEYQISEL